MTEPELPETEHVGDSHSVEDDIQATAHPQTHLTRDNSEDDARHVEVEEELEPQVVVNLRFTIVGEREISTQYT